MASFESFEFLGFLAVFLILYAVTPYHLRQLTLLVGSLVFAFWNSVLTGVILLAFTVVNYLFGRLIEDGETRKRSFLTLGLLADVVLLAVFAALRTLLGSAQPLPFKINIISFFIFACIAYLVDVYRGTIRAEQNPLKFVTATMMFPKLLRGPITRYGELSEQLDHPKYTLRNIQAGLSSFVMGFAMKLLVGNRLFAVWHANLPMYGYESISTVFAWYGLLCFSLYIYIDWQSYMLMATGIGRMLGYKLPQNFDYPYLAYTVSDFYRRWHMTLTRWFRDYLYIPLGGNRKGLPRTVVNILLVWLITGLWHGISWNFLLWGISLGILIALEKLFLGKFFEQHRALGHIYVLVLIPLTWCFFMLTDDLGGLASIGIYFSRLFPFFGRPDFVNPTDFVEPLQKSWVQVVAGIVLCFPFVESLLHRFQKSWVVSLLLAVLFWLAVYVLYKDGASLNLY